MHETDVKRIQEMTAALKADFTINLAEGASVIATNVRGGSKKFSSDNLEELKEAVAHHRDYVKNF